LVNPYHIVEDHKRSKATIMTESHDTVQVIEQLCLYISSNFILLCNYKNAVEICQIEVEYGAKIRMREERQLLTKIYERSRQWMLRCIYISIIVWLY